MIEKGKIILICREEFFRNQYNFKKSLYYFNPNDFDLISYFKGCDLKK